MARAFCIPGIVLLGISLVLSILVSLSLPYIRVFDIARATFAGRVSTESSTDVLTEIRLGIWSACAYLVSGDVVCSNSQSGYSLIIPGPIVNGASTGTATIDASWTRGLVIHVIATVVIFVAFAFSFSEHLTVTLLASLLSFLGAFFTLIAFACDIALFVHARNEFHSIPNIGDNTYTGPGFWLTFVVLILTTLAGCTVCFGRRRETRNADPLRSTRKRPWYMKWRR